MTTHPARRNLSNFSVPRRCAKRNERALYFKKKAKTVKQIPSAVGGLAQYSCTILQWSSVPFIGSVASRLTLFKHRRLLQVSIDTGVEKGNFVGKIYRIPKNLVGQKHVLIIDNQFFSHQNYAESCPGMY
jgi:hypothetical protein